MPASPHARSSFGVLALALARAPVEAAPRARRVAPRSARPAENASYQRLIDAANASSA
jgi:hypothetical protein